ncbi:MAG: cyclic nucleotide-binding domain-containing protein [Vicinamibacterales bacterium]
MGHVIEVFVSRHCPASPAAAKAVRDFGGTVPDLRLVTRDLESPGIVQLARARRLIATPATVIDGRHVIYGVPRCEALLRGLYHQPPVEPEVLAALCRPPALRPDGYTRFVAARSKIWYLQHFRMLDALSESQMQRMDQMTTMLDVPRGERIYLTGDPSDLIFLLKSGAVRISSSGADGQESILAFLHPGDLFGELAMVDDAPRDHLATAHEDTVLCAINREMVVQLVQQVPTLGYRITKLMGLRLRRFRTRVQELLCKGAPERLAHTLLDLATECGVRDTRGVKLRIRLSQSDLGNLVGLARETVNIVLQDFRQRGLIEVDGRRIRIVDEAGLRRIA